MSERENVIDLNSDLGEGFGAWSMGDDDALLDIITSANIACGFHAGDPAIMRRTCDRAVSRSVTIGAHISYQDLAGFGRRALAVEAARLRDETLYQIGALDGIARAAGGRVRYVKPHGALYHSGSSDAEVATAIVTAMSEFDAGLGLLGPLDSELEAAAGRAGIAFYGEGFADRAYTPESRLVARSAEGAVLAESAAVAQALAIAQSGTVTAVSGVAVPVRAQSICVHGDSPGAVAMARSVRAAMQDAGIALAAFA
ncbi:LamB/YcsF family protein [Antrihabitans cavernicola]|uniref:5-oxoprolinase subunit A n=1 Tax=Antrihabitans cavernicola TaxID=2495913 RepID=A0A5A7S9J0_9NOCA|nr:5-oxoprolinase subunit PxpA [Spelaeibacter cavernicola]KAA0021215.1 LamB/YcsF family protein [Spelaeibacter cavernicola]